MSASQLALHITGTPPAPEKWGVVVDEARLYSIGGSPTEWWTASAAQFHRTGRLRHLTTLIIGGSVEIGPFDREDADFARDHLIANGVRPELATIRRWTEQPHLSGCRKTAPCRLCTPTAAGAQQEGARS
ncbi:hypothetical protein UK15_07825 [Streptomyces variegatus]|uniref:Uncharacterized protein n=1 Tax=Streptomyces variegatus TaxID=284040 RepID=A0A0M2GXK3_9ACTN|nr:MULTISPECIES: hypothetical protein [Streptomyces]KJK40249.1 hypothetical protein UK15_07825 [Streptomyces variegatus]